MTKPAKNSLDATTTRIDRNKRLTNELYDSYPTSDFYLICILLIDSFITRDMVAKYDQ